MKYLRYNISDHPRFNRRKFYFRVAVILAASLAFIFLGVNRWSRTRQLLVGNLNRLEEIQNRIRQLDQSAARYREEIDEKKRQWQREVDFVNHLIRGTTRPLVEKMTLLEKILPDQGVVKELKYTQEEKGLGLTLKVSAPELTQLLDFYRELKSLPGITYFIRDEEILERENTATVILRFIDE